MITNETAKRCFYYLLAVIGPVLVAFCWNTQNHLLPMSDSTAYYRTAQNIYLKYEREGVSAAWHAAYFERSWKPVVYPLLVFPFFLMTDGDIRLTIALAIPFLFFVFLHYVFSICRTRLPPRESAAVCLLCGTTLWIFDYAHQFLSEMSFFAATAGFLFHLLKSRWFSETRSTILAAIFLSLCLMIRPAETVIGILPVLAWSIYLGKKTGKIDLATFIWTGLMAVVAATALTVSIINPKAEKSALLISRIVLLGALFRIGTLYRKKNHFEFLAFVSIVIALCAEWWIPFAKELWTWCYEASFGWVAKNYPGSSGTPNLFQIAKMSFQYFGYGYWAVIMGIAVGMVALDRSKNDLKFISLIAFCFSLLALPLFCLLISTGFDLRRIMVGVIGCYVGTGILALGDGPMRVIRTGTVYVIVILNSLVLTNATFDLPQNRKLLEFTGTYTKPIKETIPTVEIFDWLKGILPERAVVLSLGHAVQVGSHEERPFDVGLLSILSEKAGLPLDFRFPTDRKMLTKDSLSELGYTHVLMDVSTRESDSHLNEPYEQLVSYFLHSYSSSKLGDLGITTAATTTIRGTNLVLMTIKFN